MRFLKIELPGRLLEVSKLVLGTDYFGTTVQKDTAFALMDAFFEAGGNSLDTARVYAEWIPGGKGASEETVGEWIKLRKNRSDVILSTKGGHPPFGRMTEGRLDPGSIRDDLGASLKTLGVDYIDIYWVHRDEVVRPVEEIMEALNKHVREGKILSIGCSNWKTERIESANAYAKAHHLTPFYASQIQWSLAESTPEAHDDPTIVCMDQSEMTWYAKNNFPVMAYSSQAKGFFARAAANGLDAINQKAYKRFCTPANIARLERVAQYAGQHNLTPTEVALGYLLNHEVTAAAIVGCKNLDQLKDTLTAADVLIPDEAVGWLYQG